MKNSRKLAIVFGAVFMLAFAGCGDEKAVVEITPTPVPTATPTAVPPTVTPAPTATPAPRVIGVKTSQSKFIYLTNSLGTDLREIHLRASGTEEWGNNLIPIESIVKSGEQVQMYYTSEGSSTDTSADTSANSSLYDVKVVTEEGNAYEIYSVDTEDMEQATLTMDQENGVAYLRYMSLSTNSEADTRDNSQQTGYGSDTSDDSSDSYYDDSSDSYYDDSSDDYYDDSPTATMTTAPTTTMTTVLTTIMTTAPMITMTTVLTTIMTTALMITMMTVMTIPMWMPETTTVIMTTATTITTTVPTVIMMTAKIFPGIMNKASAAV